MDFGRLMTAMATPFRPDGKLDIDGIHKLVNHLIETGTTTIVACGTTGESPTLSHEEKLTLFVETLKATAGRVPVIAGTGGNDTASTIALSKEAQDLGAHGILLVAPYYNRPTQDGLYAHFSAIVESVELPIMIYNIPGRTGVNIEVDTLLKLGQLSNVFAVKEASGNFAHIVDLLARKPDDLFVYSGDDKFTLPMMAVGAYGVVSVASHVVGREMTEMMDAYVHGDVKNAMTWAGRLLPVFEALFRVSSPAPLKAALSMMDLPAGSVRLPLVAAPEYVVEELREQLTRLRKIQA